ILSVTLIIISLIVFRLATGKKDAEKPAETSNENKKFVKVQEIKNDTVSILVSGFGRVSSSRNITLTSEVQGVLFSGSSDLKPGGTFLQGQLLFKVNDNE